MKNAHLPGNSVLYCFSARTHSWRTRQRRGHGYRHGSPMAAAPAAQTTNWLRPVTTSAGTRCPVHLPRHCSGLGQGQHRRSRGVRSARAVGRKQALVYCFTAYRSGNWQVARAPYLAIPPSLLPPRRASPHSRLSLSLCFYAPAVQLSPAFSWLGWIQGLQN